MKTARWPIIILVTVLLAACAQPPVPQDQFYRLRVSPPTTALASPRLPGILEVPRFVATGLLAARPIVFGRADNPAEVNAYYYHFWMEPPAVMLRDQLITYLRATDVAKTVVTPELRLEADYILTGKIKRIEQIRGPSPKVVIALDAAITSQKDGRLLMLKSYTVEKAAANNSVTAAVDALGDVLTTIYARLVADIPAP